MVFIRRSPARRYLYPHIFQPVPKYNRSIMNLLVLLDDLLAHAETKTVVVDKSTSKIGTEHQQGSQHNACSNHPVLGLVGHGVEALLDVLQAGCVSSLVPDPSRYGNNNIVDQGVCNQDFGLCLQVSALVVKTLVLDHLCCLGDTRGS